MRDWNREELVLLNDARKQFPQRPSKETVWRWALGRGLMGVRLDSTLIGSNRYTSKQAVAQFIADVNAAAEARRQEQSPTSQPTMPTPSQRKAAASMREQQVDLARKRLAASGLA